MGAFTNTFGIGAGQGALLRYNPAQDSDIDFLVAGRTGLIMIDSVGGNNAIIQLPFLNKTVTTNTAYVADNGLLDANKSNGFTLCGWVNCQNINSSANSAFFGKTISGAVNGQYSIGAVKTSGYFYADVRVAGISYGVVSDINAATSGWTFLRLEIDNVNKILRFFINENQIGSDVSFPSAIPTLDNKYEFCVGSANEGVGAGNNRYSALSYFSDVRIYPFILTAEEGASLYTRGTVAGELAYWPLAESFFDCSGNNFHLISNIAFDTWGYSDQGSRHLLDIGYSVWKRADSKDLIIPYKSDGTPIVNSSPPTGYLKYKDFTGAPDSINLIPCIIEFTGAEWDRSNTTNFNDFARMSNYYSGKKWHISELNQFNIQNISNDVHKGKLFVNINGNSISNRDNLIEIFSCSVVKIGGAYNNVLRYTHDLSVMPTPIEIDYYYSTINYATTKGDKILAYDDIDTFTLSLDNGATFPITLVTSPALGICKHAMILENGNILFCNDTKRYYSDDNLATYQESTVLDILGNEFIPTLYDNFTPGVNNMPVIINGIEHVVLGNYSVDVETQNININVWHSKDNGITFKSVYKANTTLAPSVAYPARHVHVITYIESDNSFILTTGDSTNECNWIQATSSDNFDTWNWNILKNQNSDTYFKTTGASVLNENLIILSDATANNNINGIWSVKYDKISDNSYYRNLYSSSNNGSGFFNTGSVIIAGIAGGKYLLISKDGINWHPKILTGGPAVSTVATRGAYSNIFAPNNEGYFNISILEATEPFMRNVYSGVVLMLKVEK